MLLAGIPTRHFFGCFVDSYDLPFLKTTCSYFNYVIQPERKFFFFA